MTDVKVLEELKRENLYLKEVQKQYRNYRNTVREMLMSGELKHKSTRVGEVGLFSRPVIASDGGVDWYGEVTAEELIDGEGLASLIGLTAGVAQHSDAGWLHVGLDGTELLIAKRTLRHSIYWDQINAVNVVYGNRTVEINGQLYKVRLPKGANSDPTVDAWGYDVPHSHGSEWNRIFYRLTNDTYIDAWNTKASEEPFVHLAQYSESDLILDFRVPEPNGSFSWCQETAGSYRVIRGGDGVSYLYRPAPSYVSSYYGWRPFLERV
jgi:hypothetical protein